MDAHFTMRTYGVNQGFRFVKGIWLLRKSSQIRFFLEKTYYLCKIYFFTLFCILPLGKNECYWPNLPPHTPNIIKEYFTPILLGLTWDHSHDEIQYVILISWLFCNFAWLNYICNNRCQFKEVLIFSNL